MAANVETAAAGSRGEARARLMEAALRRFASDGVIATGLEDIRRDADVSVGALYHHFPDKASLAAALYLEIAAGFQEGFLAELRSHASAEDGVKGAVSFYLRWVSANRLEARHLLSSRPDDEELGRRNRAFLREVRGWWETHVHYGVLRALPLDLVNALWLGPAHEYTRHWLAGRAGRVPATVSSVLAEAAWQTLKEEP